MNILSKQLFIIFIDSVGQDSGRAWQEQMFSAPVSLERGLQIQGRNNLKTITSHVWQLMLVHNQLEDIIKDTTPFITAAKQTKKEQGV